MSMYVYFMSIWPYAVHIRNHHTVNWKLNSQVSWYIILYTLAIDARDSVASNKATSDWHEKEQIMRDSFSISTALWLWWWIPVWYTTSNEESGGFRLSSSYAWTVAGSAKCIVARDELKVHVHVQTDNVFRYSLRSCTCIIVPRASEKRCKTA